jgi:hypothetical protein
MIVELFVTRILAFVCKTQNTTFIEGVFCSLRKSVERSVEDDREREDVVNALFLVLRQHGLVGLWCRLNREEMWAIAAGFDAAEKKKTRKIS